MKGVAALLLFAAVGCQAGIITIRTQVRSLGRCLLRHGAKGLGSSTEPAEGFCCCLTFNVGQQRQWVVPDGQMGTMT